MYVCMCVCVCMYVCMHACMYIIHAFVRMNRTPMQVRAQSTCTLHVLCTCRHLSLRTCTPALHYTLARMHAPASTRTRRQRDLTVYSLHTHARARAHTHMYRWMDR